MKSTCLVEDPRSVPTVTRWFTTIPHTIYRHTCWQNTHCRGYSWLSTTSGMNYHPEMEGIPGGIIFACFDMGESRPLRQLDIPFDLDLQGGSHTFILEHTFCGKLLLFASLLSLASSFLLQHWSLLQSILKTSWNNHLVVSGLLDLAFTADHCWDSWAVAYKWFW